MYFDDYNYGPFNDIVVPPAEEFKDYGSSLCLYFRA